MSGQIAATELPTVQRVLETVDFKHVESTNVQMLGFAANDERAQSAIRLASGDVIPVGWLFVEFTSGSLYAYRGVPEAIAGLLLNSESKGRSFERLVKGHYDSMRLR